MLLSDLKPNETAVITGFKDFDADVINRLNVMGINLGSTIFIDPTVVILKHNQCFICDEIEFCLRYEDTKKIEIKKV